MFVENHTEIRVMTTAMRAILMQTFSMFKLHKVHSRNKQKKSLSSFVVENKKSRAKNKRQKNFKKLNAN